jgi:hypothetical protein
MGVTVGDKERVTAVQGEGCAAFHPQQGIAAADKMKLCLTGRLMKRHAKRRAGFNPAVFHARQTHAA